MATPSFRKQLSPIFFFRYIFLDSLILYGDPMSFMKEKIPVQAYKVSIGQIRLHWVLFAEIRFFFKTIISCHMATLPVRGND